MTTKMKKKVKYVIRNGVDATCEFAVVSFPFSEITIAEEGEVIIDVKTGLYVRAFSNVDAALAFSKQLNDALKNALGASETRGRKR